MGNDAQLKLLLEIRDDINDCPGISEDGLKNTMFPDDLILAIHNHLGNAYQLVESSNQAANGAEQFTALKSAQHELDSLNENLLSATETDLISNDRFLELRDKILTLEVLISDSTDPEYS